MLGLTGWLLVVAIVFAVVFPVVRYFLFRIGCILADLPDPSIGKSILAVALALAVTIPLLVFGGLQLVALEKKLTSQAGMVFYPGMVLNLVVCWLLAAVVYTLLLRASYTRTLIVSGVELLLSALLVGLATAVLLVAGAGRQIWEKGNTAGIEDRGSRIEDRGSRIEDRIQPGFVALRSSILDPRSSPLDPRGHS